MLDLSLETEALAHRLAKARNLTVDEAVRDALEARGLPRSSGKDMSPAGIAARIAATEKLVAAMGELPIIDPRPVQEIIDDINSL